MKSIKIEPDVITTVIPSNKIKHDYYITGINVVNYGKVGRYLLHLLDGRNHIIATIVWEIMMRDAELVFPVTMSPIKGRRCVKARSKSENGGYIRVKLLYNKVI